MELWLGHGMLALHLAMAVMLFSGGSYHRFER